MLTTFIEDWLLRRLSSFVKFSIPTNKSKADASRQWPESKIDQEIAHLTADSKKAAEDEKRREAEAAQQQVELDLMSAEDHPALDQAEVEALRRKMIEEEEAARRAREAEEEEEDEDDEDEDESGTNDREDDEDESAN